jgi:hypothetical protein
MRLSKNVGFLLLDGLYKHTGIGEWQSNDSVSYAFSQYSSWRFLAVFSIPTSVMVVAESYALEWSTFREYDRKRLIKYVAWFGLHL